MSQHDYNLADALGAVFRADANDLFAAIKSRNSGTTAPTDPVQGMVYVNPVDATTHEVYEYDGTNWVLKYILNPTTHEFRSVDGLRRTYGGTAGGTADALTISTTPAITAYENGQLFGFYTGASANTGAMTLNVDSVGAVSLKINGSDPAAGDVPANSMLLVRIRTTGGNVGHIIGGALPRATTSRYGNVLLDNEAGLLAGTAGKVPTSDVVKKHARERLYANRTYYVRADGNDSNTGLANTSVGAFATKQKAADVIQDTLDLNGYNVEVQVADSASYTDGVTLRGWCVGQTGAGSIVFRGNSGTPGNVVINVTSGSCFLALEGARFTVQDMELRTTTSGNCLLAYDHSAIFFSNLRFGACAGRHIDTRSNGLVRPLGSYAIVGGAQRHIFAGIGGMVDIDTTMTITLSGTPAFSQGFVNVSGGKLFCSSSKVTFSGAATGTRYFVGNNGSIDTDGGGATYFPGNASGQTFPDEEYT